MNFKILKINLTDFDNRYVQSSDLWKLPVTQIHDQDYTVLTTDVVIELTPTPSDNLTATLPPVASVDIGKMYIFKSSGSLGGFTWTISGDGSEKIDGSITKAISTNYGTFSIYSNGTGWLTF